MIPMLTSKPGTITVTIPDAPPPRPRPLPPRPSVLVVLSSDGFAEVFASPGVRIHVAERLNAAPGNEDLADEYLDLTLPTWARGTYWPRNLVATHTIRGLTIMEEAERLTDLALVRELIAIGRGPVPTPDPIRKARVKR